MLHALLALTALLGSAAPRLAAPPSLLAIPGCTASQDPEPAELDADARRRYHQRPHAARIVALNDKASDELKARIAEPEAYWALLTDPGTSFDERAAAAYQGERHFPYEWVPRLMAALGELRAEEREHNWGLRRNPPQSDITEDDEWWNELPARIHGWTETQRSRRVLGHIWRAPATVQGWFPLSDDLEEARAAPWPLQVKIALEILLRSAAPRMGGPNCVSVPRNEQWLDATLRMPCRTDDEALLFVEAACAVTHHIEERLLARYRSLVVDSRFPRSAERMLFEIGEYPRMAMCADPRTVPQFQVLLIDAIDGPLPEQARHLAAWAIPKLRAQWGERPRRPAPATLILLASERGLSRTSATASHDLSAFLFSACEAMDAPPFVPDRRAGLEAPQKWIDEYRQWFEAERQDLERAAALERPALDAARARLIELAGR